MPRYLIERRIPAVGKMTGDELKAISQKSNKVLQEMSREGKNVQWIESYVTDDAINCVYLASDSDTVLEHARRGGFPADNVIEVREVIDPTTAE